MSLRGSDGKTRRTAVTPGTVEGAAAWVAALGGLASTELRRQLDPEGADAFGLKELEVGTCPDRPVEWLPPRPPSTTSAVFRQRVPDRPTMVWYEHLSKAGGTSFCKLARTNMPRKEVPSYYCMPSEPGMPDARVGQWTNAKLETYFAEKAHRLVSNEWEAFPRERLQLQPTSEVDANTRDLHLVFVSNIREPLNRLLSAYNFWGVLHNPSSVKPTFDKWVKNMENRAARDERSPRGMGKGPGTGQDFIAQVGRPNFACWKFSSGKMPIDLDADQPESLRRLSEAVQTAARFDLVVPMELLSDHTEPLAELLGWTDFSQTHVVPSGKVVNNDAKDKLSPENYDLLWNQNRYDMLLYTWLKAVFLIRVNCGL